FAPPEENYKCGRDFAAWLGLVPRQFSSGGKERLGRVSKAGQSTMAAIPPAACYVETAGLGGWDILGAYQFGVEYPCVIRGEGVGRAEDGRRVYFGERSRPPFGAWAERTVVPSAEVWDVPDDVDDQLAITMAIAGTGALIPLERTEIKPGDNVLILGGT